MRGRQKSAYIVWSGRTDGLGERLCSLLNAIMLASALNWRFCFSWSDSTRPCSYRNVDKSVINNIAVASNFPAEMVFSRLFIRRHLQQERPLGSFISIKKNFSPEKLWEATRSPDFAGFTSTQILLDDRIFFLGGSKTELAYQKAFAQVRLSKSFRKLVTYSRRVQLPENFVAVHLRSGDVIYGDSRKWGRWSHKVLVPSIASRYVTGLSALGRNVVVFGQNSKFVREIATLPNVYSASTFCPADVGSPAHAAFLEMMIMSRASSIISGNSGFSRFAAMVGGAPVVQPNKSLRPRAFLRIIESQLGEQGEQSDSFTKAVSLFQAYLFNKGTLDHQRLIDILTRASDFDPSNPLYKVILSALYYGLGHIDRADAIVSGYIQDSEVTSLQSSEFIQILLSTHPKMGPTCGEYFTHFKNAGRDSLLARECSMLIDAKFPNFLRSEPG